MQRHFNPLKSNLWKDDRQKMLTSGRLLLAEAYLSFRLNFKWVVNISIHAFKAVHSEPEDILISQGTYHDMNYILGYYPVFVRLVSLCLNLT